jgi:di/tricarboxylate transporter
MTLAAGYVMGLVVVALVLFAIDALRIDVVALILLLLLTIPSRWIEGLLTADEAVAGFGSTTIVVLIALFILTAGIIRTGVVERLGLRLAAIGSTRPVGFSRFLVLAVAAISAFVSNTVTTAVFLPLALGASKRAKFPASKILIPIAFASILSGTMTVIGTSTNLVVAGQMRRLGMEPLGFFEMTKVASVIAVIGIFYLIFVAPRLIPDRGQAEVDKPGPDRKFRTEVVVAPKSKLAGKTLAQLGLSDVMDLFVVHIRRRSRRVPRPFAHDRIQPGDEIVVEGRASEILAVKDVAGMDIKPDVKADTKRAEHEDKKDPKQEQRIVEAMVLPRSPLVGKSLSDAGFREETGLTVLGVHSTRRDPKVEKLSDRTLRASDVLLLQGTQKHIEELPHESLLVLDDVSGHHPRSPRGIVAATIFIACMALGASGTFALPIALLLGVLAMIVTRCLTPEEAYASVDWRLLVMIGAMFAFGAAMEKSGAAAWIAGGIVEHVSPYGSYAVLASFFIVTILLSQPMSNQAAALVVLPVAVHTAHQLGMNPRSIVIAVTLAASCSFLTPLEPACLLVYGPGRYRFIDFARIGFPLTLIMFVISMLLVPVFWPLQAAS